MSEAIKEFSTGGVDGQKPDETWTSEMLGGIIRRAPRADRWDSELVGNRIIDALRTLARMPLSVLPRAVRTVWPEFQGMTPKERRAMEFEAHQAGTLRGLYADRNRVRIPPSSTEIELMEEAIGWVPRYLGDDSESAMIVTGWRGELTDDGEIPTPVRVALRVISQGLNRDRVRVR